VEKLLTMPKACYNAYMFNKPNKVDTMSDNAKFVAGIIIIVTIAALGFVLVASYFDVLVK
jgi:hypothetical protein